MLINTDPTSSDTCKYGVTIYRSVNHRNHEETEQQHMIKLAIKLAMRAVTDRATYRHQCNALEVLQ